MWDFHTTIYAKNVKEFNKLKNKIYTEFKHLIIKRDIGVLVNVYQYPKRYIIEEIKEKQEPIIFADDIVENDIELLYIWTLV